jgi:hypothetical protein
MMQIMDSGLIAACLISVFAALKGSYGDDESAKIFGFLRSGEKCLEQSNPDVCLKKKLLAYCEKNNEGVLEGKPISKICQCTEDDSSMDELRECITEHIQTYCAANPDNFKCTMFERCKDGEVVSKKQCMQDLCKEPDNVDKFECLALGCKQNYEKPPQKLNCIKEACASNEDVNICKKIKACQAENSGPFLGKIKVFKCLLNSVFDSLRT